MLIADSRLVSLIKTLMDEKMIGFVRYSSEWLDMGVDYVYWELLMRFIRVIDSRTDILRISFNAINNGFSVYRFIISPSILGIIKYTQNLPNLPQDPRPNTSFKMILNFD